MKIKVNREWLETNVFNHKFNGAIWKQVIEDYKCIGQHQFDVYIKNGGRYGVRVGFFDKRLPNNKVYITVPEGHYEIVK